jgi:RimJ/RimL family protein N-acetyltransferase
MNIDVPLFYGERICLAGIDHEHDPAIESAWTQDAGYMRMVSTEPARPLSGAAIKKKYEKIEKDMEDSNRMFYFTIRMKEDDRLIGWCRVKRIEWSNGRGTIEMGIGSAEDRGKGLGYEALGLLLRYVFGELNLFRVAVFIPSYNEPALALAKKAGFVQEVCHREAIYRDGKRWDFLEYGLLYDEWKASLT